MVCGAGRVLEEDHEVNSRCRQLLYFNNLSTKNYNRFRSYSHLSADSHSTHVRRACPNRVAKLEESPWISIPNQKKSDGYSKAITSAVITLFIRVFFGMVIKLLTIQSFGVSIVGADKRPGAFTPIGSAIILCFVREEKKTLSISNSQCKHSSNNNSNASSYAHEHTHIQR